MYYMLAVGKVPSKLSWLRNTLPSASRRNCIQGTGHLHDTIKRKGLSIIGTGGGAHVGWAQTFLVLTHQGGAMLGQKPLPERCGIMQQGSLYLPPLSSLSGLQILPLFHPLPPSSPRHAPLCFSQPQESKEGNKRKHQPCRIPRREWPFATIANSSSRNLRPRGASASSCSRSMRRCSRWWWTGSDKKTRAMMISRPACLLTSAATQCLILTSSLMRIARRARSSSSLGLLTRPGQGARCCTRAPRTASRGSWTASRWSYRRLTRAR